MIYCLTGELLFCDAATYTVVIDCGGVGYKATVTSTAISSLASHIGEKVRIYTHLQVREDGVELYGFYTTKELETFKILISVSGVGPKAALSVLSTLTPDSLSLAVSSEDIKAISKSPGVGAKIAARIILELKDKLGIVLADTVPDAPKSGNSHSQPGKLNDARDALLVLGFSRSEVTAALTKCSTDGDTEDIIRSALGILMK